MLNSILVLGFRIHIPIEYKNIQGTRPFFPFFFDLFRTLHESLFEKGQMYGNVCFGLSCVLIPSAVFCGALYGVFHINF